MSAPENPFAYPLAMYPDSVDNPGMTLRDHFAGQALIGQLAFSPRDAFEKAHHPVDVAELAYRFADAMLAERVRTAPLKWFPMSAAVTVDGPTVIGDVEGAEVRMTFWQKFEAWRVIFPDGRVGAPVEPTRWRHLTDEEKARG